MASQTTGDSLAVGNNRLIGEKRSSRHGKISGETIRKTV